MESRQQFNSWIHRFCRITGVLLAIPMFGFPVVCSIIYGVWPSVIELWPAFLAMFLYLLPWWPAEHFGYMSVMGPGAMYMGYITGNITNLRMPATVGTLNALGIEPNTDKCHTLAIIACAGSVITSILVLALGMVAAVPLSPVLNSELLKPAFDYVLPALFGGLVAQSVLKGVKEFGLWIVLVAVCMFFASCTSLGAAYYMLITVILGAFLYWLIAYKFDKKSEETHSNS